MYRKTFKPISFCAFLICTTLLSGCEKPAQQYDYSIFAFGTLIDITLYDVDKKQAETAFEQLQKDFDQYHQHWSPWTNGDLAKLNTQLIEQAGTGKAIDLPEHLIPLIKQSTQLSQESDNYYNPTIGNLINLWQFHKYQKKDVHPPENGAIQKLINKNPQMSDLSLNENNQLSSINSAVSLNFGAFAKGYAIEREIQQLKKLNIHHAVINAGGDLSVIGQHGDRPWNIGIRHPREDNILASIEVRNNESIFTSGDYERFYTYQNQRFHHILDPGTGYPTHDAQSVTVLHSDAGRADAAATALFVAGSHDWQRIAKKMGIDHVMLIDSKGHIHLTPAMEKRIKFLNKSPASHIIVSEEL
ncbi:Thiamin biosynthesis lipoprotein ApbE [hydrothermal vent metagenome]|uniref:FAD:protein FMN transferase n=1 Tax=hydrothermal vent metagenome TaxID=652676 RepID=A0A3B0XG42_9ZZZZ